VKRRRTSSQRGFTLVELLVTMMVTVIGLVGMLGVFGSASRGNLDARQYTEALGICEGTVEEIRGLTIDTIETLDLPTPDYYGVITTTGWGPVAYHKGPVLGATGVTFIRQVQARAIDADLVWIQVIVQWTTDGAPLGTNGGANDRRISLEMVRGRSEGPPG
jgi:prepilin-type N-terminal cleavage/methylation domain-containing protein